jgi:hypothetical protein
MNFLSECGGLSIVGKSIGFKGVSRPLQDGQPFLSGHYGPGRPTFNLVEPLRSLLEDSPFAAYKFLTGRVMVSRLNVAWVLRDDLSLARYVKRWAPQDLTAAQKIGHVRLSENLLECLRVHYDTEVKGITTGDKS